MSKQFKSTQEEQDEAFFGTGNVVRRHRKRNDRNKHYDRDEKLARELQEQYRMSDRSTSRDEQKAIQERQDMEFARMLQRNGSLGNGNLTIAVTSITAITAITTIIAELI